MPRTITSISIFLASPSDVDLERDLVTRTIDQWNAVNGKHRNVMFELLRWETSVSAGFGNDGQEVINSQIRDEYDLLIAIFWSRFGSATPRAASGTVEEYERALARFKSNEKIDIAFFFKDQPVDFRNSDLTQLQSLKDFEKEVQLSGALTKSFKDNDALRFEVDLLLDRIARDSGSKEIAQSPNGAGEPLHDGAGNDVDDEIGLLDIMESLQKHAELSGQFLAKLSSELNSVTETTDIVLSEVNDITQVRALEPKETKPFIDRVATGMNIFSTFLERDSDSFDENVSLMVGSIRSLINVSYDFIENEPESATHLENFQVVLIQVFGAMKYSERNLVDLLSTTSSFPRTTTNLNRSRTRFARNIKSLIDSMKSNRSLVELALRELSVLIATAKSNDMPDRNTDD